MSTYGNDYEKITVSTSVVSLDTDKVAEASRAMLCVEASSSKHLRLRYDGEDPTAATGSRWADGQTLILGGQENLENFRAIRADDEDVTLHVHYESFDLDGD